MKKHYMKYSGALFLLILGLGILILTCKGELKENTRNNKEVSVVMKEGKQQFQSIEVKDKEKADNYRQENLTEEKHNITAFKKEMIDHGVYVRLDDKLERATPENLKQIEKQIKHPVIYELDKDGEMIKVIAEASTLKEGDQ